MFTWAIVIWSTVLLLLIAAVVIHIMTMPKRSSGETSRINRAIDETLRMNGIRTLIHKINFLVFLVLILTIGILAWIYGQRGSRNAQWEFSLLAPPMAAVDSSRA